MPARLARVQAATHTKCDHHLWHRRHTSPPLTLIVMLLRRRGESSRLIARSFPHHSGTGPLLGPRRTRAWSYLTSDFHWAKLGE